MGRFIVRPGRLRLTLQAGDGAIVRLLDLKLEGRVVKLLSKTILAARKHFATNESGLLNHEDTADLIVAQLMLAIQEDKGA